MALRSFRAEELAGVHGQRNVIYIAISEVKVLVDFDLNFDKLQTYLEDITHMFPTCLVLAEMDVLQGEVLTKHNFHPSLR